MPIVTPIILTGGTATRMRPLSLDESKSMISFMGKPLLLHLVKSLKLDGFSDLVLTSSGRRGEIKEFFSDGTQLGVHITYYDAPRFHGSAGTIRALVDEMADMISDPFLVIYGDSLLKANYKKMLAFHVEKKSACTILYHRPNFSSFLYEYHDKAFEESGERTNYGVMDIDSNSRITKVREKELIAKIRDEFADPVANAAVYLLDKRTLDFVPSNQAFDFPRHLFPLLLKEAVPCFGCDIDEGYRVDIGTLPQYYSTQLALLEGKLDFHFPFPPCREGIWIGRGSIIGSVDELKKPVLIHRDTIIDEGTNVECSIIGNNVFIGKSSSIDRSIVLDNAFIGDEVSISHSIIGASSVVGSNVSVPPYTVLGSYCRLGDPQLVMKESDFWGLIQS